MSYVITIGRQTGCGGRIIGKDLADRLGIEYYDKNIIHQLIADDCGIDEGVVSELMEKRGSSLLYEMANFGKSTPLEEQIYISKTKIIKELADNHTCVIVGKCADYILRDYDNVLKVFLYGSPEDRINRLVNEYHEYESLTEHDLRTLDRKRANYYHFFTTLKWGERRNYDLLVNTHLGLDSVTAMLETIVRGRFGG